MCAEAQKQRVVVCIFHDSRVCWFHVSGLNTSHGDYKQKLVLGSFSDLVLCLSVQGGIEINDSLSADGEKHLWKLALQSVLSLTSAPFHLQKHNRDTKVFTPERKETGTFH